MIQKRIIPIVLISVILVSLMPLNSFSLEDQTLKGMNFAEAHLNNISFNDIGGHWATEPIQFVSALSLMRGSGNNIFNPNGTLTHAQALTVIVNSLGLEEEAQRLGENLAPERVRDIIILNAVSNWYNGYIQVATQTGILTPRETANILNLSEDELDTLEDRILDQLDGYYDRNLDAEEMARLQDQIDNLNRTEASWGKAVSREQVALWIARALELEPVYGDNIVLIYELSDWRNIDTEAIPLIEAILQEGLMQGSGGRFNPRGNLTRAQMAQILYNMHEHILDNLGLTKYTGQVSTINNLQEGSTQIRRILIRNEDGESVFIELNPRDIIVQKNNQLSLSGALASRDYVSYFVNEDDEVIFASVEREERREIDGDIESIDKENLQLRVLDFNDRRHQVTANNNTQVSINGKEAKFEDLLPGQEVSIILLNDRVIEINGFLYEDPTRDGYIPPGTRTKVGTVLFLDSDEIEIQTNDGRERYAITPVTEILRSDKGANLFEIKIGDRVHLSFDNIYDPEISIIRVEDEEKHIEGIYRANLDHVNTRNGNITISQISKYDQGRWNNLNEYITLNARDAEMFKGARGISLNELAREQGNEVYIAAERSYGSFKAARVLVKDGSIMTYHSPVTSVSYGTSRLILDNNQVNFHDGTIVIKNDRLVDNLNLDIGQTIFASVDQRLGNRNLSLAVITDGNSLNDRPDNTRIAIYRGNIEEIRDGQITVHRLGSNRNFLKLENNRWTELNRRRHFTLTEDSLIKDSDLQEQIDSRFFMDTRFIDPDEIDNRDLRERVRNNYYVNKPAYFVVRETTLNGTTYEELLALNITPTLNPTLREVQLDHVGTGNLKEVDVVNETITLSNGQNWNDLSNRWEFVGEDQEINLNKAIILVNDRPLLPEEIYRVRPRGTAYVLKVKEDSLGDKAYIIIVEQ